MKTFLMTCVLFYTAVNANAADTVSSTTVFKITPNEWKAVEVLNKSKFVCTNKLKDYNFENEFKLLFGFSYSNRNVSAIKSMSQVIQKQMLESCKTHQNTGFNVQTCYEACWKNYKSDEQEAIREQCQATCASLDRNIHAVVPDLAALLDNEVVHAEKCEKSSAHINNSSRDKIKEREQKSEPKSTSSSELGTSK